VNKSKHNHFSQTQKKKGTNPNANSAKGKESRGIGNKMMMSMNSDTLKMLWKDMKHPKQKSH
jgi:hypothetical protein